MAKAVATHREVLVICPDCQRRVGKIIIPVGETGSLFCKRCKRKITKSVRREPDGHLIVTSSAGKVA